MKKPKLQKLIQEIAMFDIAAAFTLHCRKEYEDYLDKDNLDNAMAWRKTPEGYAYWGDINMRLEARRKNHHPHRDLMIELANDKTINIETFMCEKWVECKEPSFYSDAEYRKKPKATKKVIEYRIYLTTENEICVLQSKLRAPEENFQEWRGDWQKIEIEVQEND